LVAPLPGDNPFGGAAGREREDGDVDTVVDEAVGAAVAVGCVLASQVGGSAARAAVPSTLWAWGNGAGELGKGTTTDSHTPVPVSGLSGVTAIAAAAHHSLAVKSDGTAWAWGYNGFGQLGNSTTTDSSTPVAVSLPSGTTVTAIAGGEYHSLALTSTGQVLAWS
jgi:YD repeat-containing protein